MDDQNRNLILATALSFLVILVWAYFAPPAEEPLPVDTEVSAVEGTPTASGVVDTEAATDGDAVGEAAPEAGRIGIETPALTGSISLAGGRIDSLSLNNYHTEVGGEEDVTLLSPVGSGRQPYYALFGWAPGSGLEFSDVPGADTIWQADGNSTLTPDSPVTLTWDSPAGLTFRRTIEVDEEFLFTVTQSVENTSDATHRLAPFGRVERVGEPQDLKGFFIIHEGAIQMTDGILGTEAYDNLPDLDADDLWGANAQVTVAEETGWIGFTDHYWMTTLAPEPGTPFRAVMKYVANADTYRTEARLPTVEVAPGQTSEVTTHVFAGAKEWEAIRAYERDLGIDNFTDAIDWGWFYFLTKPIFQVLHWLNAVIGNMGWAIIALTLLIKAILFPLARKSYISMARMKELQPEMEKLKERAGDDRQKLQTEMMALYKKEKVNPASGCLPILLQIPIFFSLYKVIFVTIELRHAGWFGPFQDLSAPDPTSIWNIFGLLPYAAPDPNSILALIFIGILPLLLGISMWLQQKLNPAPPDPTQAMIFAWMPWVFMFMLGGFASGLVVYWIANNTITFIQQYLIMRSHGYTPDVFGNIKASFKKDKPAEAPKAANEAKAPSAEPAEAVEAEDAVAGDTDTTEGAAPSGNAPRQNKPRKKRKKRK